MFSNLGAASREISALAIAVFLSTVTSDVSAAGFRKIIANDITIGVWYPSNSPTETQRLGPIDVNIARNAPVMDAKHDIVLFSHGNGGRYHNHYLTAQSLADAGFVVVAPQHEADYLVGGSRTARALDHRYLELATALKAVMADMEFADHLNTETVHGLGYSLGGATMLLAAGAEYSTQRVLRHCEKNAWADSEFCEDPGWIFRLVQSFRHNVTLPNTSDPFRNEPILNGRLVLVAPVSQGIDPTIQLAVSALTLFAIDGDSIAMPKFHARPIFDAISREVQSDYQTIQGHHFAFIAPFPKWLTDQENIPAATDPEGFDRVAFLNEINGRILSAFLGCATATQSLGICHE